MSISASLVKELRERTGAGMMECKKALVAADGNIDVAIDNMRKAGTAKAAKKAGRIAGEGIIVMKTSGEGDYAVALEINSETDFVARDEGFKAFSEQVAERALNARITDVDTLMNLSMEDGGDVTIEQARTALIAKIGENIRVRRICVLGGGDGLVGTYLHGGRIGVLVHIENGNPDLAKDIAMHVAASNPQVVAPEDVSEALIQTEKEIFTAQALESGKPAEIVEKMIGGRIKKFLGEISLLGQPFVKDPSITVEKLLGGQAKVTQFIRIEVGEGIEKKEENFAEEVMAQVRG